MKSSAILLLLLVACDENGNQVPPQNAAKQFMTDLGLSSQVQGISCAGTDSDCDGYVTCTVSRRENSDSPVVMDSLQCAALGSGRGIGTSYICGPPTSGCKGTLAKVAAPATNNVTVITR